MIDFAFFAEIIPTLLSGLPLTLQLAGLSIGIGFALALLLALAQQGNHRMTMRVPRHVAARCHAGKNRRSVGHPP